MLGVRGGCGGVTVVMLGWRSLLISRISSSIAARPPPPSIRVIRPIMAPAPVRSVLRVPCETSDWELLSLEGFSPGHGRATHPLLLPVAPTATSGSGRWATAAGMGLDTGERRGRAPVELLRRAMFSSELRRRSEAEKRDLLDARNG